LAVKNSEDYESKGRTGQAFSGSFLTTPHFFKNVSFPSLRGAIGDKAIQEIRVFWIAALPLVARDDEIEG
ncbi:MAG TPA: hypothetical protein PK513_00110, partial [Alphaproteobacteria bacterium]|nr:hypothetical protein [Alphaproteobacteria bacterium]